MLFPTPTKSHDNINSGVNQLLVNFVYNQMMEKKDDLQVKYVKVYSYFRRRFRQTKTKAVSNYEIDTVNVWTKCQDSAAT